MKILIVYATFFGNTEKVAKMIQQHCGADAELQHVNNVHSVIGYDMVIIGSPTRAFRPTKPIVNLVKSFGNESTRMIAFFDTRVDPTTIEQGFVHKMMKWFGYSNDTLEKIARKKKLNVRLPSGEFCVKDSEGPLVDTIEEDVRKWVTMICRSKEETV
ncbi:flavodoxin family protein [Candidatus Xianfuyuplasma coldseepsis]|uniref:Flavodoxin family protein n=1 Tax=Candidatus Xianfuyuplasma coldseepsis TaxID=2782163 RepID=A0A7L7KPJ5_9MOLU|nr:flavodoxin domain-containing protein [Xianfuyuplasma coldseepsis]QMS84587.1 flavodoxin family protein [Xianfuyuplasma coldseepsis]